MKKIIMVVLMMVVLGFNLFAEEKAAEYGVRVESPVVLSWAGK
jgi:hypothetical protein